MSLSEVEQAIRNRIEKRGNLVNFLVYRALCPRDDSDRRDAIDGLRAICWKAKGNLFVPATNLRPSYPDIVVESPSGTYFEYTDWDTVKSATKEFLAAELHQQLEPFRKFSRTKIAALALEGRFRFSVKQVINALVDFIRQQKSKKRTKAMEKERLEKAEYRRIEGQPESPQYMTLLIKSFNNNREHLINHLGERGFETLKILAGAYPFSGKGDVTEAIAKARRISVQQARADKRTLLRDIENSHLPVLLTLQVSKFFKSIRADEKVSKKMPKKEPELSFSTSPCE